MQRQQCHPLYCGASQASCSLLVLGAKLCRLSVQIDRCDRLVCCPDSTTGEAGGRYVCHVIVFGSRHVVECATTYTCVASRVLEAVSRAMASGCASFPSGNVQWLAVDALFVCYRNLGASGPNGLSSFGILRRASSLHCASDMLASFGSKHT